MPFRLFTLLSLAPLSSFSSTPLSCTALSRSTFLLHCIVAILPRLLLLHCTEARPILLHCAVAFLPLLFLLHFHLTLPRPPLHTRKAFLLHCIVAVVVLLLHSPLLHCPLSLCLPPPLHRRHSPPLLHRGTTHSPPLCRRLPPTPPPPPLPSRTALVLHCTLAKPSSSIASSLLSYGPSSSVFSFSKPPMFSRTPLSLRNASRSARAHHHVNSVLPSTTRSFAITENSWLPHLANKRYVFMYF